MESETLRRLKWITKAWDLMDFRDIARLVVAERHQRHCWS